MRAGSATRDPRFVTVLVAVVALSLVSAMTWGSQSTSAGTGPKGIRGYVWDSSWNPVPNANVTVRMYNGAILTDTQYYDATEPDGFYAVTFAFDKWNDGYIVELTATYGVFSDVNTTIALDGYPYQWLNATLDGFVIPELGSGIVVALTVAGLMAIVVAVGTRRRGRQ